MLKFKNYKILLLLMLFAFAGKDALAGGGGSDPWYFSNAKVETVPTGAGKVYAGKQTDAANPTNCVAAPHVFDGKTHKSNLPYNWYVNTIPTDSKKYKFLRWEDGNGNVLSTDQNPEDPFKDTEGVKGTGSDTNTNPGTVTVNYIAVYEEIINQYVSVESQNPQYLTATIDKPENEIGDDVTLWAYPNNYNSKFTGWTKDGEIVSMENPWTFTIDESNAGIYIATYKTGYNFYRFRNKETSRRFNAISDQGSITNFSSLQLVNGDVATYSAGSVVQISMHHISGGDVYDYIMQNSHTSAYYSESDGEYITMSLNSVDNTWTINPNRQPVYMADENGANVSSSPYNNLDKSKWYIDPIDKDLETKENYFSLDPDPAKLVEVDGKYYTTLRTSWNILFNPEQMTPYVVTEVDEVNGTFDMEPISGNIIPAGTPVIIETKSNDVEENRMVPTKKAEASGAVPSGNQLVSSTKYFPNQSVAVANNYKKLMVNDNGQLAFGGNALSTVNGNEAYLRVDKEVVKIPILHLADIERDGIKNKHYTIADTLIAVDYCHVDGTEDVYLWCKDQKNASIFPTNKNEDQIDFMRQGGNDAPQKGEWDQSNWVVLKLTGPDGLNKAEEAVPTINGQKQKRFIKEKTVTGKYIDDKNFMIEVENNNFTVEEGEASYTPNVYATTNFLLENLNIWGDERDGGYTSGNPNQNYFFMNPKIQEVCTVTYAVWDKDRSMFVVPSSSGFTGSINVAWDYNEPLGVAEALTQVIENSQVEIAYNFLAVVNRTDFGYGPGFEPSKSTSDNPLLVYPLNLDPANENNVITAIDGVQSGKTVTHVVYYNLLGVASDKPHHGINIVETRYSDGTRTTTKVIR